jgi:1,4-dihydroxy-6-naphthoate synthase
MRLSLGFSTCPNDTFIFEPLLHGRVDTEGLIFEPFLADVEQLNQKAFKAELDITKLSYHTLGWVRDKYALLNSGSALGHGCGPLLISKPEFDIQTADLERIKVAIPGKFTTANLLFGLAFPQAKHRIEYLFSDIETAILEGAVDAGLIIHEQRFTYAQKGLKKLLDLGEYWENMTQKPIPLGGITARKDLGKEIIQKIDRVLQKSVNFALANPDSGYEYIRQHAQSMEKSVMYQHIGLYVNDYTRDLGESGHAAVRFLFEKAEHLQLIPPFNPSFYS